jgi:hypothetical protein
MSVVLCKLPKAGLGNQLFPLLKAFTFGQINNLPVIVTGYNRLFIGPYLRGEKSKRNYRNYFVFQKSVLGAQWDLWRNRHIKDLQVNEEPALQRLPRPDDGRQLYVYGAIPHWSDYFEGLRDHRDAVNTLLHQLLKPHIKKQVEKLPPPCIGVHIRMGDFRKLAAGEDFSKVGTVRTPEPYFIETIQAIRNIHGSDLPVSVFTDGYRHEFEQLFALKNISLVEGNVDIVDMLLLSKSNIIVTSAGSTFSYWSGFLANVPLIVHPDHLHASIRPAVANKHWYEGPFDHNSSLLVQSIQRISPNEKQDQ